MKHEQYVLTIQTMSKTLKDIAYLINGHNFGENRQDISILLDRNDTLELLKDINTSVYEEVSINTEGEYFIVTSSVEDYSAFFVENIYTEDGRLKLHETDILILPHYLPQGIKTKFVEKGDCLKTIELSIVNAYDLLVEIINE